MLLGVTLLRKKYPPAKYLCVLLIVAGVALFMYKPKKGAGSDDHVFGYGELLLVSTANVQVTPAGVRRNRPVTAQIRLCPLYLKRSLKLMWKWFPRRTPGFEGALGSCDMTSVHEYMRTPLSLEC